MRPTASLGLFIQQTGRALRPSDSKAVIIDHVNNFKNFGFPDDDREWTLTGKKKKKKKKGGVDSVRQCQACYFVYPVRFQHCPQCGAQWELSREEIAEIEGNLEKMRRDQQVRIEQREARRVRYIEENQCETLEDWQRLARQRGYKIGWAYMRWQLYLKKLRKKKVA
jgi:superfamily II DNA or RNA helicase